MLITDYNNTANLVPRVSLSPPPRALLGAGRERDPGNEVAIQQGLYYMKKKKIDFARHQHDSSPRLQLCCIGSSGRVGVKVYFFSPSISLAILFVMLSFSGVDQIFRLTSPPLLYNIL